MPRPGAAAGAGWDFRGAGTEAGAGVSGAAARWLRGGGGAGGSAGTAAGAGLAAGVPDWIEYGPAGGSAAGGVAAAGGVYAFAGATAWLAGRSLAMAWEKSPARSCRVFRGPGARNR